MLAEVRLRAAQLAAVGAGPQQTGLILPQSAGKRNIIRGHRALR